MNTDALAFALAAGLVAAVNPCGFAMLPGYLSLVVASEGTASGGAAPAGAATGERAAAARATAVGRALAATAAMTAGFLVVFGTFGLVIAPLTSSIEQYLPAVTVVIGVGLIGLGGWLLAGRELTLLLPKPGRGAPTRRLGSMFGYGLAYALASLSCTIGPFLAVTTATFRADSLLAGVLAYLAYGLGMAIVVGVLAVGIALAGTSAAGGFRRVLPYVNRISGALLVVTGLYVAYYGVYELRLFHGNGSAADPVVDVAISIQGVLVGWVDSVGALPLLAVLLLVAAVVTVGAVLTRRRRVRMTRSPE
jgi:cytochrome c-type biogenesis protein